MSALQNVDWEACLLEPREDPDLDREVKRAFGFVPNGFPYYYSCPWLVRAQIRCNPFNLPLAHTDFAFSELVSLVVSQDNSCRYCYAASRTLLRILGHGDAEIRRLEDNLAAAELAPERKVALDFARRVSRANPIPSADQKRRLIEAGYDQGQIRELVFLVAINVFANRIATLPALPPQFMEQLDGRWYVRLARPLLGSLLRFKIKPGKPEFLTPEEKSGPYSYVVEALDGLPAARQQRAVLDDAWSSPILGRRAKGLVLAVVARTLDCPRSEEEALRLLAEEGLSPEVAAGILAHLGGPDLDPIETVILPFARDTVWYEPAQIQRRAHAVRQHLTPEQFLELVGIAALANAICRCSGVLADGAGREG
jgi:AhpD family alkylhydroperoxidase